MRANIIFLWLILSVLCTGCATPEDTGNGGRGDNITEYMEKKADGEKTEAENEMQMPEAAGNPPPSAKPLKHKKPLTSVTKKAEKRKKIKKTVSVPEKGKNTGPSASLTPAQKELDAILADPALEKLELFIRKYREKEIYAPLLKTAQEKYKEILLAQ
ncbi:MAG: hypothetical protein V2I97_14445 [Desulfococcaceae bacterium]|jgi:hypothetical protein|nr:hypothetical protein [Desulfococcaceae bacterium]